jgi:hypothetical protein
VHTEVHLSKIVNDSLLELYQKYRDLQNCHQGILVKTKEGILEKISRETNKSNL